MTGATGADSPLGLARQVWALFDPSQKRECAFVVAVSIVAGCFTLVGVAGIAPFFAVLADPTVVDRNATLAWLHERAAFLSPASFPVALGVGFVTLLLLSNAANLLAILSIGRFSQGVGASFHALLFEEYLNRDYAFHTRSNGSILATHVVYEVNRTVGGVVQAGLTLVASAVSVALIAGAVVLVNPAIALGAALVLGLSYAAIYALVRRRLIRNGSVTAQLWDMRAKVIAESFDAIKDVILLRAQKELGARVARQSDAIAEAQASTAAIAVSPRYVLECVTAAGLVAAALWIYRTAGPGQWLTQLAFIGLAAYRLLPAVQQAFAATARIRSDGVGFARIADDLRRARERALQPRPAPAAVDWIGRPRREIRLSGVSYRHSPDRPGGVSDISMRIPAGAIVGLVGPNGSGKSTLADLILGLLQPETGRIEIDGVTLDEGNRAGWTTAVAHVPQHIALLDTTVAQNVAFGVAADDLDAGQVRAALREARLEAVVDAMPAGLETVVGEGGVRLSGGQRQRLGIARALYRRASLLVMDEATNALDVLTEAEVVALLEALRGTCTVVIIAHRQSSLRGCDLLYELDGGRLVASGSSPGRPPAWPRLQPVEETRP